MNFAKTIIISAGHSNGDPGAIAANGMREADLALRIRNRVATTLRADGEFRILTDGSDSENKPLRDAIQILKANPGALAVEFHFNAAGRPSVKGIEILCGSEKKTLAQELAVSIATVTGSPLRGILGWKPTNSGQHHRLGFCDAGGLIIELEFLSNPDALAHYLKHEDEVATSLANALRDAAKGK